MAGCLTMFSCPVSSANFRGKMPATSLNVVFMHGTEEFLRVVFDKIEEYASDELCHAANFIIHQLRAEVKDAARVGYIFDKDLFHGGMERETPLTTNGIYSILHECQIFHHQEIRFSVEEEPAYRSVVPVRKFSRLDACEEIYISHLFRNVEQKQKGFCASHVELFSESDASFTDFLRKLETRQKDIMRKFQSVSFSSSDGEPQRGIELGLEALTDDVFQPQLSCPEQDIFFDTTDNFLDEKEPLLAEWNECKSSKKEVESILDKIIDELMGKVESLGVKNRRFDDDELVADEEKRVAEMSAEISKLERDMHMEAVAKKKTTDPRAKLSMTVATSTEIKGKLVQLTTETQTESSGSDDEIALIRHALAVIQKKRRRMSTISKKSPELKKKKLRSSRSPKCSCCRKEKKDEKSMDRVEKTDKKQKDKKEKKVEKEKWNLGAAFPSDWAVPKKDKFDLKAELDKALPTVSEPEEPFNRKLREKWAHDGMKSLKRTTPIHSVRMPAGSKLPNRFHRFQPVEGVKHDHDEYCDKYNLARLDGKIYKLVPRFSGVTTPLNKNYPGQSSVPATIHMALMDESDPWLNWDNHYCKTYRALNVGSRTLKGLRVQVIHQDNMELARDISKIPETVPMDYTVDFELMFSLLDHEKDGLCVMQLKNHEGAIVSPAFVFIGKKLDRPVSPKRVLSEDIPTAPEASIEMEISTTQVVERNDEDEEDYEKVNETEEEESSSSDFELVDGEDN